MKSKELIRLLQEEDPTGEVEVCVGNADIFFLEGMSAYWDGKLQVLKRDPSKAPYFDVVGAKYVVSGKKIKIHTMSITDLLCDHPDMEIDYSELGANARAYREQDDKTRALSRHIERQVDLHAFQKWAEGKIAVTMPQFDKEKLDSDAEYFYDKHLSPDDIPPVLPPKKHKDGYTWHASWNERREYGWSQTISIGWDGLDFAFTKTSSSDASESPSSPSKDT